MTAIHVPTEIQALIDARALFVISHSGGKDSQAQMIALMRVVPAAQVLVVHASLGEMEWHGALELARDQAAAAGVPFRVAKAAKSFLDMVEHRFATRPDVPSFPSASVRQCTSDLKRDPIAKVVRAHMREHGFTQIVDCQGLRAAESPKRAKLQAFAKVERESVERSARHPGRAWFVWLPIHAWSTAQVFAEIRDAGQEPHPAYAAGNERLSCVFCVMGSDNDIRQGAAARPELFARYAALEARTGYSMHQSRRTLAEIVMTPHHGSLAAIVEAVEAESLALAA